MMKANIHAASKAKLSGQLRFLGLLDSAFLIFSPLNLHPSRVCDGRWLVGMAGLAVFIKGIWHLRLKIYQWPNSFMRKIVNQALDLVKCAINLQISQDS